MSRWTEERDATLRRRWKAGDSGGDIARALGLTRNAVMGRLGRLGLLGERPTPARPVKQNRVDPQKAIDARDLDILDALVDGEDQRQVARRFSVAPEHVRDLWEAREACA